MLSPASMPRSTVSAVRTWSSSPISGVQATGYIDRVVAALRSRPVTVHLVPWGEPTLDSVDAAAAVVRDVEGATVIGVGGGSALDIAKQAAVVSVDTASVEAYLLCAEPLPGRRPIVAIPTTSGTGAEVTRTCIVADTSGRKLWTWGDEMLPDVVVLDPTAVATMPHAVTVGTGLDAFVHAVEACSGQRRNTIAAASAQRAHLPRGRPPATGGCRRWRSRFAAVDAGGCISRRRRDRQLRHGRGSLDRPCTWLAVPRSSRHLGRRRIVCRVGMERCRRGPTPTSTLLGR